MQKSNLRSLLNFNQDLNLHLFKKLEILYFTKAFHDKIQKHYTKNKIYLNKYLTSLNTKIDKITSYAISTKEINLKRPDKKFDHTKDVEEKEFRKLNITEYDIIVEPIKRSPPFYPQHSIKDLNFLDRS